MKTAITIDIPSEVSSTYVPRGKSCELSAADDLEFQILHWTSADEGEVPPPSIDENGREQRWFQERREHAIYMNGVTSSGLGVTLRTTFDPYFYIKLESQTGRPWTNAEVRDYLKCQLLGRIKNRKTYDGGFIAEEHSRYYQTYSDPDAETKEERDDSKVYLSYESALIDYEIQWKKDLDAGFTGPDPKRFQFVKLTFRTFESMQKASRRVTASYDKETQRWLRNKRFKVSVYEANLEPKLRLMHLTGVEAAGWVRVPANSYKFMTGGRKESRTLVEVNVRDWKRLEPLEKEAIAPFRQLSFDLETYSPDPAKFSNPELHDNYIIQIASLFSDFGTGEDPVKVLYNLGPCDPIDEPNTVLRCFDSERDMLVAWAKLVQQSDPDIVHAYNGWEFDYAYLAIRAKVTGCWDEFRKLGKLREYDSRLFEKTMSSGAYGDNHWKLLPMSGRLVIDPMVHIKREHKLRFYNLNYVSEWFLSKKLKNPLSIRKGKRQVKVRHGNHGFKVGDVVKFSDIDTPDVEETDDGKYFYALAGWTFEQLHRLHTIVAIKSEHEYVIEMPTPATKTLTRVGGNSVKAFESKHDISFERMFEAWRNGEADIMNKVGRYCIQDTMLPQKILDKLCVLPNLIEMAKVTWVPMEYLITRGQQIKCFSQICKEAHENDWRVPTIQHSYDTDDEDEEDEGIGYTGGAVLDPFIGFYTDPIAVPDFKSLYPCTMIDGNYCYTTLVKDPRYLNLPGVQYNVVEMDDGRKHIYAMCYDGLVPEILATLLITRGKRKKMMNDAQTPLEYMIHNGAQLALKVSANSIYGFTGVQPKKAMLPCMAIAESTTAQGRKSTFRARDYAENPDNFKDIINCTTHFPMNYYYLMKDPESNGHFHMTAAKLLAAHKITLDEECSGGDKRFLPLEEPPDLQTPVVEVDDCGLKCWTSEKWATIVGFSRVRRDYIEGDLIRVHTDHGTTLDMTHYRAKVLGLQQCRYTRSTQVGEKDRTCETALEMAEKNICTTVYGDTDSIFLLYDTSHLEGEDMRCAYTSIVSAFVADRITQYLRSFNPWKPIDKQWMELEYEKTYRFWILFSKKRYAGEMMEFNPYDFSEDKKGVALKRRDFCTFVKEVYSKVLKCLFDPDRSVDRTTRVHNALNVVCRAIEDLINNRVPFEKMIISKLLKDHYKSAEKKQTKGSTAAHKSDFGPHNIFVDDRVTWRSREFICTGVVQKKHDTTAFHSEASKKKSPLEVKILKTEHADENIPIDERTGIPKSLTPGKRFRMQYSHIESKKDSIIYLEKILDPETLPEEIEKIKHPHVRLARKMHLRDPATTPPSGSRVPFIFVETESDDVDQYQKAEHPDYAKEHNLVLDPIYYLEHQCANAWGQILDTVYPGVIDEIYKEAFEAYRRRRKQMVTLRGFVAGDRNTDYDIRLTRFWEKETFSLAGLHKRQMIHEAAKSRKRRKKTEQKTKITSFFAPKQ